mgnify:CR=1 FL=1
MENLKNTPNFLWLRDISYDQISQVGGKASSLGEMYTNLSDLGIKVPNAFTLTTHLFRQFMKNIQSQIDEIISEVDIDDPKSLKIHASKVRNIISNQDFSDDLKLFCRDREISSFILVEKVFTLKAKEKKI